MITLESIILGLLAFFVWGLFTKKKGQKWF